MTRHDGGVVMPTTDLVFTESETGMRVSVCVSESCHGKNYNISIHQVHSYPLLCFLPFLSLYLPTPKKLLHWHNQHVQGSCSEIKWPPAMCERESTITPFPPQIISPALLLGFSALTFVCWDHRQAPPQLLTHLPPLFTQPTFCFLDGMLPGSVTKIKTKRPRLKFKVIVTLTSLWEMRETAG